MFKVTQRLTDIAKMMKLLRVQWVVLLFFIWSHFSTWPQAVLVTADHNTNWMLLWKMNDAQQYFDAQTWVAKVSCHCPNLHILFFFLILITWHDFLMTFIKLYLNIQTCEKKIQAKAIAPLHEIWKISKYYSSPQPLAKDKTRCWITSWDGNQGYLPGFDNEHTNFTLRVLYLDFKFSSTGSTLRTITYLLSEVLHTFTSTLSLKKKIIASLLIKQL